MYLHAACATAQMQKSKDNFEKSVLCLHYMAGNPIFKKEEEEEVGGGREESLVYMKSWAQFPVPHFVSVCVNSKSVSFYRTVKLVKWCAVYTLFQVYLESRRYSGTLTQQIQTLDLILNTKNTSSFSHEKITSKEWEI